MADLYDRIAQLTGAEIAERVIEILDEEASQRCRDADCIRLFPHSRLSRHLWRHEAAAPLSLGLLGMRCFTCGRPTWRRVHRTRPRS